jgi:hypothetical protein
MESYSLYVELTAIQGANVQTSSATGQQCLIIPLNQADLKVSTNGKVYLNLSMWAKRRVDPNTGLDDRGHSHDIKQSFSKERREALPQGTYPPSLGQAKPIAAKQYPLQTAPVPQGYAPVNPSTEDFVF